MSEETDDQQNLPAVPTGSGVATLEIPVAEFEGEYVRIMHGKLPGVTLEMDHGYRRDTHLKIELEVRVRSVTVDEVKSGRNKGDLVRIHEFALEEAKILGAYTSEQLDEGVGGSASVGAQTDDDEQGEQADLDARPEGDDYEGEEHERGDRLDPGF